MADPTTTQRSYLEMSDEEMLNAAPPEETSTEPTAAPVETDAAAGETATEAVPQTTPDEVAEDGDAASAGTAIEKSPDDAGEPGEPAPKNTDKPATEPVVDPEAKPKTEPVKEAPKIDFEAEYKRLLAPFKANGRDIQVDSVDDAVALMQMGANYNKKMAALKPNLKLMKMLENNGFLSEEKIGFLIDLGKKDPAAISKLVKDSGFDPMDLDTEKASAYKQTAYAVDDREIELDTVLDELQGTPTYTQVLDVVSNKWDVASKQTVSQAPQLLKVLNDHMASGIYGLISKEIEKERLFGRLNGLSDIEAYRQVGDAIQARGGFNHLVKTQSATPNPVPEIVESKPKALDNTDLNDKRRAASSTKAAAFTASQSTFNPLSMSDEEFSKVAVPAYR